ncbi:hypothetical protein GCM10018773_30430 [Streptomyces candidus]|nr:hypothetical protein GCM10018773_30430 [Streptomyces candidus]
MAPPREGSAAPHWLKASEPWGLGDEPTGPFTALGRPALACSRTRIDALPLWTCIAASAARHRAAAGTLALYPVRRTP